MSTEEYRPWEVEHGSLRNGPGALNVGQIVTAYEGQGVSRTVTHKDSNLPGPGTNLGAHESFE